MMIPLWIKVVVLALLLGASHAALFWLGGEHTRKEVAEDKLESVLTEVKALHEASAELQQKLDNLPKSENTIRETVREYPAPCPMPEPVADKLQEAVRQANSARKM